MKVKGGSHDTYPLMGNVNLKKDYTEEETVLIIKSVNKGERYWFQETISMQNPRPNMAPQGPTTFSDVTSDEFGKEKIFPPFVDFILKSVENFPNLFLYVHKGPLGFYPIFGVRYFNNKLGNPYIIKFKDSHLSKNDYLYMISILYAKKNTEKILQARLEEIKKLHDYFY